MDLGYLNARIHAWKSRLISKEAYTRLLGADEQNDIGSYKDALSGTDYGRLMELGGANIKEAENLIAYAIKRNFDERLALLWRQSPEETRPLLKALLAPWEGSALKAIIRGIEMKAPKTELAASIGPAGEFDKNAIEELCSATDLPMLIGILRAWGSSYAVPLAMKLKNYLRTGNLQDVELAIDKFSLTHHGTALPGNPADVDIIKDALADKTDSTNIMTLFKLSGESFTKDAAGELFIDNGRRITAKVFSSLLEIKDREELVSTLAEKIRDKAWQKALYSAKLTGVITLEEDLEFITARRIAGEARIKPLGIAPAAAYIFRLIRETKNLRMILRGKRYSIPRPVLDELILIH